ncbi:cysteine-rich and transmembrane domain-containing protein WIH2-like [Pieris napi]|uniref:cysteine-rich and transmembrane domain-containing protein WIH2-like n=1 Tax=Pieris napi TaxID=78633 RepID=UPI001FB9278C|nr:cysteine-rich and transmembrane domain-containing protein WIH2-like [Pieris napi]
MAKMISIFALFVLSILHAHAAPQGVPIPENYYNPPPDVPPTSYHPAAAPADTPFPYQGYPPNFYPVNTPRSPPFYPGFKNSNYPVHLVPNNPVPIVPLTQPIPIIVKRRA